MYGCEQWKFHSYPLARRTPLNWNISISRTPSIFAPLTWPHGPLVVVPFASKQPHLRPFWTVSVVDHAILWLNMTQTCTTRMFQIARNDPSSCSKLLSVAKSCSKLFKIAQNASKCFIFSKCFKMHQRLSKGMMCLHMQVRKWSLLGIAVAGVYCCMGLRSVSVAHDATFRPLNRQFQLTGSGRESSPCWGGGGV